MGTPDLTTGDNLDFELDSKLWEGKISLQSLTVGSDVISRYRLSALS